MVVHPSLARARFESEIAPLLENVAVFERGGIRLRSYTFPNLLVDLKSNHGWHALSVSANDFDYRPLDAHFVGEDGLPLFAGRGLLPSNAGFQPYPVPGHSVTNWLCFSGWSAFHDHSGHQNDASWSTLRSKPEYRPLALLQNLQKELTNPAVGFV